MFAPLSGPRRPGHLKRPGRGPLLGATIQVRPAQTTDEQAIVTLSEAVLAEGGAFLADADEPGDPTPLSALLRGDNSGAVVALRAGSPEIIGVALLRGAPFRRLRHTSTLELIVAAESRGAGVGGALLDAAVALLRSRPALRWLRLSVYADNTPAIALYRSRGFVEEGARVGFSIEPDGRLRDDLLMRLDLSEG